MHPEFTLFHLVPCKLQKKWMDGKELLDSVTGLKMGMFVVIVICQNNLCNQRTPLLFSIQDSLPHKWFCILITTEDGPFHLPPEFRNGKCNCLRYYLQRTIILNDGISRNYWLVNTGTHFLYSLQRCKWNFYVYIKVLISCFFWKKVCCLGICQHFGAPLAMEHTMLQLSLKCVPCA